jgi:hypothetical protein
MIALLILKEEFKKIKNLSDFGAIFLKPRGFVALNEVDDKSASCPRRP